MKEDNKEVASQPSGEGKQRRKMKKGWKIAIISICSLLGLVVVTAAVALWLLLTPARLTSIVNKLSDKFILCENSFGDVDLTLFKTFPFVTLHVGDVTLVNPVKGAPDDTLASIGDVNVGINLREYLKNGNIEVNRIWIENVTANLFSDSCGTTNYDIFPKSDDTSASEPFEMPELVSLKMVKVKHLSGTYLNQESNIDALLDNLNVEVSGQYLRKEIDGSLEIKIDGVDFTMSDDSSAIAASLKDMAYCLKADNGKDGFEGDMDMRVRSGLIAINGQQFVNDAVAGSKGDLLRLEGGFAGNLESGTIKVDDMTLRLKDYEIAVNGDAILPKPEHPMSVDLSFETNLWGVKELLAMLPASFSEWQKGMTIDAEAKLTGTAKGNVGGGELPLITANLNLKKGSFTDKSLIPYSISDVNADLSAQLNLNDGGVSSVEVNSLSARSGRNSLSITGHIGDLLGAMLIDANLKGNLFLADAKPMLPDDLNMDLEGKAQLNLKAKTSLDLLQKGDFKKMKLTGNIGLTSLDVEYDTIYAKIPKATVNVQLPATMKRGLFSELLSATLSATSIEARMPNNAINGRLGETHLQAAISDIFDSTMPFRVVCDFNIASLAGNMDSIKASVSQPSGTFAMIPLSTKSQKVKYQIELNSSALHCEVNDTAKIDLAGLSVKGGANYDPSKSNTLQQWSPTFDVDFKRGYIDLMGVDYIVQIPDIKFNYKPERCEIASANVVFGNSDFYLSGAVTGLEKWLSHEEMLKGDLHFTSNYTNVDDLMEVLSGLGVNADTLETQRKEDNVDTSAHPFIVPLDVDFTLHTRIKEATAFDNDLREVAGDVQICNGVAVLNQVGFVCKAAKMQLTGMYRTPRVNHIFVGMDFHLLDINIQELIEMIPYVDTLVPLLNDLEGNADFHLCAETYVDAFYKPKMSTMRGAAALTGQNLVVLDNKDIDRIAKLLQLKKWREDDTKIHVDSLDIAMTVFRDELEVYPFLISLNKYGIVAEGRHNLNNEYNYHVELVQTPFAVRLAVDVLGTLPELNFDVSTKLKYKNLYRPAKRSDVDNEVLRLKSMIRKSLEANVKEDTRKYQGFDN